ncbi:MAG: hypothetical protein K8R87_08945 [Verrucomicrobia bacterium]|nr:hypothetical protein [Verrucomicrobiota bacterium]
MSRALRFSLALFGTLLVVGGFAALLLLNPTAREVTLDSLGLIFAFFTTPFILETTCAALFLFGLLAYNRWRLHQEGDGWVWLMTQEQDEKKLPAAITQRLQSTVLINKPESLDEAQAEAGVIEGYLDLGMATQARKELETDPSAAESHPSIEAVILRIRVLAANLENDAAMQLLHSTTAAVPESQPAFAAACLENARWLLKHLHRDDLAKLWLAQAQLFDAVAMHDLPAADPLRALI